MAGIIKKVEQTLGMGRPKKGDKQSGVHKHGYGGQQKVGGGFLDKVKGKIPGMGGQWAKGRKKKKNIDHFEQGYGEQGFGEHKAEQGYGELRSEQGHGERKAGQGHGEQGYGERKAEEGYGEQKEGGGFMDKVKGKIHGKGGQE
ncbi:unnamed protein product [Ilex paraguariensis]|uniref:Uncharacterized protein n=1 Tax=Ilex paraguariensis TaxID=185542 RepID=A0ABC8U0A5_9AQUA